MDKEKAIPQGYMTIGEVAKKMNTTVRTLQYYDKEKLLIPSAESTGGRRLYTDKDLVKLHQIMSLKSLGFTLDDIKNNLPALETPKQVAEALSRQAESMKAQIEALQESIYEIEALGEEVLQMQSVDFKRYADIIVNLQMKNDNYWLLKHFDDQLLEQLRFRFDKNSGAQMMEKLKRLQQEALTLKETSEPPDSEKAQKYAKDFWDMIMEFTQGDMSMLPKLMELGTSGATNEEWKKRQTIVNEYSEAALEIYLESLGVNPFNIE